MKRLGLGLGLSVFGLGLGPYWTCYKAHSLQVCFAAYNNMFETRKSDYKGLVF